MRESYKYIFVYLCSSIDSQCGMILIRITAAICTLSTEVVLFMSNQWERV